MGAKALRTFIWLFPIAGVMLLSVLDPWSCAVGPNTDLFTALRVTRVESGSSTAAFDLKDLDGRMIHSRELTGRVVLLNFWATWCGPCKEEMPSLARLQSRFESRQFQVVTVTTDMHPKGIKQYLDHLGIHLTVLFDEHEDVSRFYMVRGLPTTVLITSDGRVVGRAVGSRPWDSEEAVDLVRYLSEGMK